MTEMLLVMPFVLVILSLLILFGRELVRVQRAQVLDRSTVWRSVGRGPGPGGTSAQMNDMFFGGNADDVGATAAGAFPSAGGAALMDAMAAADPRTVDLAARLLVDLPDGLRHRVSVEHGNDVPLWERLRGPIHHRHTRLEHEWRQANGWRHVEGRPWRDGARNWPLQHGDPAVDSAWAPAWEAWPAHGPWHPTGPRASNRPTVAAVYFEPFEAALARLAEDDRAVPMARLVRGIYLAEPRYHGPTVGYE